MAISHSGFAGFVTSIIPINNLSVGVVTAVNFYGDGSFLTNAGIGSTGSVNTSGIITASRLSGDGSGLTDVGGYLAGLVYSPTVAATGVALTSNISITFNKSIQAGVGTITLRTDSSTGTIIESFNVGTSSSISISGATLTINPTNNLSGLTTYYVVVPSGTIKDTYNTGGNIGITSYYFTSAQVLYPLFAWGDNQIGPLGQNNTTQYSSPVQIPGNEWSSVNGIEKSSYALKTDGTLWTWGQNQSGMLGQNNTTYYSSPVQIPGTQWSSIAKGTSQYFIMSTKTDGTLWAWGFNGGGPLGQNNRTPYSSPVQIPGTQWSSISVGQAFSFAIKTDGTLWAWGGNGAGQLGQSDRSSRSSPVQIPGTQWSSVISSAGAHILSTKTDGTLWVWGGTALGQLGLNVSGISAYRSSPVQIPGTQWNTIASGRHLLATKTDGTLWSWGPNSYGELGQSNTTYYSSPVQIPGTSWNLLDCSDYSSIATKTDGTLWSWGYNNRGQVGQNITSSGFSSPVQIPGTSWSSLGTGQTFLFAIKTE